jgi:DNA-binding Xre family transcriptional regulator
VKQLKRHTSYLTYNTRCDILTVDIKHICGGIRMRKDEKMREETVKRKLDKKIANGDKMCPLTVIRLSRGLTQTELAKRAGMTQSNIGRIENGERDMSGITMGVGYRIAKALGCRMEELL